VSEKNKDKTLEQFSEITCLLKSIRDLMILNLSYTKAPHENIARAAHIQTSKLYDIIPKRKGKKKKDLEKDEE